jgi:hypothetical protein
MSSIPLSTRPARGRTHSTRPARRSGYRAALAAAEKRGREQTDQGWMKLAGDLIKNGRQQYWHGYAHGLTSFAHTTEDAPAAEDAREYAQVIADQYAAEGVDTRDWTLPAGAVVPGTEVPDVEHLPCPAWCVDCGRGKPGSGDHARFHHSEIVSVAAHGESLDRPAMIEVSVERLDDGVRVAEAASVCIDADGRFLNLTAPVARQLAAHLLNAADTIDAEDGAL